MVEERGSEDCLPPGTALLQGQFLIERFLNAGGFGITYLARDSLDRPVVIKECFPITMCCRNSIDVRARSRNHQVEFEAVVRLFGQEARRMAKLDHPNIVGVHDVFEENGTAYIALEHVDGRDLLDIIEIDPGRLGPQQVRDLTFKLLDAVAHVHSKGILHRDISPDNVLLDRNNEPVLIDFGAARDTARSASRVLSAIHVVKDGYSPQEFYLAGTEQTPASDLYSLAATLYHLLMGEAPIYSHIRLAALAERKPDPYMPLAGRIAGYDDAFLQAIDKSLSIFPKNRLQRAEDWMSLLAGSKRRAERLAASDDTIASSIERLVQETNEVVRLEQERSRREAEEEAQRIAIERQRQEEERHRIREEAIREAEDAAKASARRRALGRSETEKEVASVRQEGERRFSLKRLLRRTRQRKLKQAMAEMRGVRP